MSLNNRFIRPDFPLTLSKQERHDRLLEQGKKYRAERRYDNPNEPVPDAFNRILAAIEQDKRTQANIDLLNTQDTE